jgi:hypothetical protein
MPAGGTKGCWVRSDGTTWGSTTTQKSVGWSRLDACGVYVARAKQAKAGWTLEIDDGLVYERTETPEAMRGARHELSTASPPPEARRNFTMERRSRPPEIEQGARVQRRATAEAVRSDSWRRGEPWPGQPPATGPVRRSPVRRRRCPSKSG